MTFSFFLSIYPRCVVPASWAAQHIIVCLDTVEIYHTVQYNLEKETLVELVESLAELSKG